MVTPDAGQYSNSYLRRLIMPSNIVWPSDIYRFTVVPFPMALGGPGARPDVYIAGSSALDFINRLALIDSAGGAGLKEGVVTKTNF
jgi:hypothetical protein